MALLLCGLDGAAVAQTTSPQGADPTAASSAPQARRIVQQRTPDGRVIFSDQPEPGARIERQWTVEPETAADAARRRASAEGNAREAQALNDRLARRLEQERERDLQLEIERLRADKARAERDAAQARAEAAAQPPVIVLPRWRAPLPVPVPPPRVETPLRPGPQPGPRPGATPPPRPPGAPPEPSRF